MPHPIAPPPAPPQLHEKRENRGEIKLSAPQLHENREVAAPKEARPAPAPVPSPEPAGKKKRTRAEVEGDPDVKKVLGQIGGSVVDWSENDNPGGK